MADFAHSPIPHQASEFACVDFVNSSFTDHLGERPAVDRLPSPEWRRWFVGRYGLTPDASTPAPLAELTALRRDLRRVLEKWSQQLSLSARDVRVLNERIGAATMCRRVTRSASGLTLQQEPVRRDWAWVMASVVESAVELMSTGTPARLKTCTNPDCSWLFYDNTVNGSKQYCCTTPCGTLMRVRRFREGAR